MINLTVFWYDNLQTRSLVTHRALYMRGGILCRANRWLAEGASYPPSWL